MNLQKAGEILDELLEKDAVQHRPALRAQEYAAINAMLLDMQAAGKYKSKDDTASPNVINAIDLKSPLAYDPQQIARQVRSAPRHV